LKNLTLIPSEFAPLLNAGEGRNEILYKDKTTSDPVLAIGRGQSSCPLSSEKPPDDDTDDHDADSDLLRKIWVKWLFGTSLCVKEVVQCIPTFYEEIQRKHK
jgi:hypothetical protein